MADQKYTKLTDLLGHSDMIKIEAGSRGHDAFMPTPVRVQDENGQATVRGQSNPAQMENSLLGRILLFLPTKEKVTVVREKVGKSYRGMWLHEVTTKDGKKFLALQTQLQELVK